MRSKGNPEKAERRVSLVKIALISSLFAFVSDLDAASGKSQSKQSASANLQIMVNVVPIVQSPNAAPAQKQNSAITYRLEESPREQRHELRILPPSPSNSAGAKNAAILDTLVVVPQ